MKILIAEDDKMSKFYLEQLLQNNNYDFRSAENGIKALTIYDEYQPDIVLTDINMPIMDGMELLEAIREKSQTTIIVIITAYSSERRAIDALRSGANYYLKKPIDSKNILLLLNKYKTILSGRYATERLPGAITLKAFSIIFDSEFNKIPKIVDRIIIESALDLSESEKLNIELGLGELITNAIEHGNLNISYAEKRAALNKGDIAKLYEERANSPKYAGRKVRVDFFQDHEKYQWTITDHGKGFKWSEIPNPTENKHISELSGRGIYICRFLFDKIEYSSKGNMVTATKFRLNR